MPTHEQIQKQLAEDLQTKQALQGQGDDEEKTHVVEHHFVAREQSALTGIAKIGRMLGFNASEILQGQTKSGQPYWYFDLLSETPTYLNDLARQSLLMLTFAEAYGADYDGWGTIIEKS